MQVPKLAMSLRVGALWRYPVKTLAGERLVSARLTESGVEGDRLVRVRGPEGVRTSRRHYRLLGLRGTLDENGRPLVNGRPWDSPEALADVKRVAGSDAWLEAAPVDERFDVLPLLVATDGAVAAFGRDVRRLRPNLVIAGVAGLDERTWPGSELQIGPAIMRLDSLRGRCPMTTVDPDTLARDPEVLRDIGRRFGGRLALNAWVVRGGVIHEGDAVTLAPKPTAPMTSGNRDESRHLINPKPAVVGSWASLSGKRPGQRHSRWLSSQWIRRAQPNRCGGV